MAKYEPCSFAYRPGLSYQMAVQQVAQWRDRQYIWVLDADIVQYFDNVQHPRLLAEVAERLNEPLFLTLIEKWLSVGAMTKQGLVIPEKGLPQGAVISPILANIYLDDFDELISATDMKLVRYADDFLVLARSQERIMQARSQIAELFVSWGLQMHPNKTQVTNFEQGFCFLGQKFVNNTICVAEKSIQEVPSLATSSNTYLPQPTQSNVLKASRANVRTTPLSLVAAEKSVAKTSINCKETGNRSRYAIALRP